MQFCTREVTMINKWEQEKKQRKLSQLITYLMLCFIIYSNTDEQSNVFVDNQRRSSLLFGIRSTLVTTSLFVHTVSLTKELCIIYLSHNRSSAMNVHSVKYRTFT